MIGMRWVVASALIGWAGCASVRPVATAAVPPPWPKPGPTAVERHAPAPPPPNEEGKPPVPPQKDEIVPKSPTPPHSG